MPEHFESKYFEFTIQKGVTLMDLRMTHPSRFYNQDWYFNEPFANRPTPDDRVYKILTKVSDDYRGKPPSSLPFFSCNLPSAAVYTYAFVAYWIETGKFLWEHDYTWTSDLDSYGDPIYVGGYSINKPGFEIHRHLSLRPCHSVAFEL